jgi:hypothetical protein
MTAAARRTYAASFSAGHGPCAACGPRITIPDGLPAREVERRARALRRGHFTALAFMSAMSRTHRRREQQP